MMFYVCVPQGEGEARGSGGEGAAGEGGAGPQPGHGGAGHVSGGPGARQKPPGTRITFGHTERICSVASILLVIRRVYAQ